MFKSNLDEKRKFRRVNFSEPVSFELNDPNFFGGCLSADISESGMRLNFNDFIPLNTQLKIQFYLRNQEVLECKARVVWIQNVRFSDSYQVGLEFESFHTGIETRNRVRTYIDNITSNTN